MKEIFERLRVALMVILVVIAVALGCIRLMTIQIVNGDAYLKEAENVSVYTQNIKSTRGIIVDSKGVPIVDNKVGYNVIIDDAFFPSDNKEGNEILLSTLEILKSYDLEWIETIPVTKSAPYEFTKDSEADVEKLKELIGVNIYATAENCIDKLIDDYEISADEYTPEEQRTLAGIRYEMKLRDFSINNTYTLCEDVPIEVVTKLKELGVRLKGINIAEDAVRFIAEGDVIPHEIGTVGPIYAEEYEELSKKGYAMNDQVGKGGIERALESELRGEDGTKTITITNGNVTSADVTEEPKGGHTVKLTVDSEFQRDVQSILENFITYISNSAYEYKDVSCGSLVVLDVKDNGILAMATAPTYNLKDYKTHYDDILEAENNPLLNRATYGLYRPGSTFKTITATAGLNEGIVSGETTYKCEQEYKFYDITVGCTGFHNDISVSRALRVSCNIYFYELGRRLGIDKLTEYANLYGYGLNTGIETGDSAGYFANPETFDALGGDWTVGQVLQASIGQSETAVTPLQMACVASTIANRGVRYTPHLVEGVYDYAMTEEIKKTQPEIAQQIDLNYSYVYDYVIDGMIQASENNFPYEYSLSNLGFDVAIKTGTPQSSRDGKSGTDTCFIGFAPAYDPQIAFAGIVEGGEYSKYMIRSIIEAYYKRYEDTVIGDEKIKFLRESEKNDKTDSSQESTSATETAEEDPSAEETTPAEE
ncbi:MAG: peptidoglycan D,D-transpeptidase FtsI family protein [Porcipelethomonas sp.]